MSIDSRFVHSLVIERASVDAVDDYNQPTRSWGTLATVPGLVQPKSAREVAQLNEAGAVGSIFTIYLRPMSPAWLAEFADPGLASQGPIKEADFVRFDPDDGRRFELTGIRDAAGLGHHLECDARLVTV